MSRDALPLWARRARSLRNVCALGVIPFVVLAGFGFLEISTGVGVLAFEPPGFAIVAAACVAGAIAAARRPFAVAVALAVAATLAEGGLLFLVSRPVSPDPYDVTFGVLSVFWPLSFASWAIDLRGADRWIRERPEDWKRGRRDRKAVVPPAPRAAFTLRCLAAPLGAGLLVFGLVRIYLSLNLFWF